MGTTQSVPANYSVAAYAIIGVQIFLVTSAVAARTLSRRLMKAKTSVDDCLSYLAYIANIGLLASGLILTASGALNLEVISNRSAYLKQFARDTFCALALLYVFSVTFIKLSILFFYRRTFTMFERWFQLAWWATLVLVMLWAIACIVLIVLQNTGALPKSGFSRIGISTTGLVNGFSDIILMILPAIMISRMRLLKKQKIAIIGIFMIGGIAAIVSIVRGVILFTSRHQKLNEAYSNYLDVVLASTEASAGLMCACLPLTKPLVTCISKIIRRMRGLNTEDQGWTINSTTQKSPAKEDRTILRVDDYHVQLMPASRDSQSSKSTFSQETLDGRDAIGSENPWQKV